MRTSLKNRFWRTANFLYNSVYYTQTCQDQSTRSKQIVVSRRNRCLDRNLSRVIAGHPSIFIAVYNRESRKMEWDACDEYDYHQEIARSGFADMLHDHERNRKFDEGIRRAVSLVHARGQRSRVLDIGTGSGLLSMMAVRAGAHHVTACEAFEPMSECAGRVISDNAMTDRIHLVHKRSTDMTVGPEGDMSERANILVAELLDTELIGEGALHTYRHAHELLLTPDCVCVPLSANIHIQLVYSPHLSRHNNVAPVTIPDAATVHVPSDVTSCSGSPSVHDLQLNQVHPRMFTQISRPQRVFRFDFSGQSEIPLSGAAVSEVTALTPGKVDAVFVWWDIEMDPQGELVVSCAPSWAHPNINQMQWRDHWLQAIYYPPQPISVTKGQQVKVTSYHDDYSLWFDVSNTINDIAVPMERPICRCGLHTACSRQRIAQLGHTYRRNVYIHALKKVLRKDSVCLVISDGSLLPFMAARLGASMVYVVERDHMLRRICKQYILTNKLEDRVHVLDDDIEALTTGHFNGNKIDAMISEPHFSASSLPGDDFYCWHAFSQLTNHASPNIRVLPGRVSLKVIGVEFEDLWKINSPLGQCEGFDMDSFDRLIEDSTDKSDTYLEPQPLWEYPCVSLTQPVEVMNFDWTRPVHDHKVCIFDDKIGFESSGTCNGVVVWMEYTFPESGTISTGVIGACSPGDRVSWDPYTKQSVHLLRYPRPVNSGHSKLSCWAEFSPQNLDFDFKFDVLDC